MNIVHLLKRSRSHIPAGVGILVLTVGVHAIPTALMGQCTDQQPPKAGCLSPSTIAQIAHQYFTPSSDTHPILATACDDLVTAVAIAGMESDFYSQEKFINTDGSIDYGLWQSNDDTTGQAPAPNACGVGSAADFVPATALQDFVCQMVKTGRGFSISNAYKDRFSKRQKDWAKYWILAQVAAQPFRSECSCQPAQDFNVYVSGSSFVCPPIHPPKPGATLSGQQITSGDPNDKVGSQGVGPSRYLLGGQPMMYSIYFDNVPIATAPAQKVVVTDQLNSSLVDLTTLTLGPIGFVDKLATPPSVPLSILGSYSTDVDLRPAKNLIVRVAASINQAEGVLNWTYTSLDPTTMQPTTDPLAGFLPPGTEGSVSFNLVPKTALTGTQITNKATIVFDVNPPIDTPVWLNTIDNTKPTSHVLALPATQTTGNFTVSWVGSDTGAGIQDYAVYASDNGGSFTPWQANTTATSANFTGTVGHTYRFYSIARDLVGNVETAKSTAEATTTLITPPTIQCTGCYFLISGVRATLAFNVASAGTTSTFTYNYRTSTQTVQFVSTTTSQIVVNGNTATFSGQGKLNGIAGYNFTVTAKDGGGVGSGLDTVLIAITGPNDYSYSVNGTIAGGDIVVKQ